LFPNPASTSFSVSTEGNALLEITTLAGVKIMSKQIEGNETISIQNFPKAMYIVKVTNVKGEKSTTLIVK
jgi:hypothetical protein